MMTSSKNVWRHGFDFYVFQNYLGPTTYLQSFIFRSLTVHELDRGGGLFAPPQPL